LGNPKQSYLTNKTVDVIWDTVYNRIE